MEDTMASANNTMILPEGEISIDFGGTLSSKKRHLGKEPIEMLSSHNFENNTFERVGEEQKFRPQISRLISFDAQIEETISKNTLSSINMDSK